MKVTDEMVNRFLTWPLPKSVGADYCATKPGYLGRTGTNLLNAEQARQMLEYVFAGPNAKEGTNGQATSTTTWKELAGGGVDPAPDRFVTDVAPGASTPTGGTLNTSKLMGKSLWVGGMIVSDTGMTISSGAVTMNTQPIRTEKSAPDGYRLAKKPDGTLVLQGAYMWQEGVTYGHEWRDIPTVDLEAPTILTTPKGSP